MTAIKERYAILALLGIGAIVLLVYLMRQQSQGTGSNEDVTDETYPNVDAAPAAVATVPSAPVSNAPGLYQFYNLGPQGRGNGGTVTGSTVAAAPAQGNDASTPCGCGQQPGSFVVRNTIPGDVYQSAVDNFQSFVGTLVPGPGYAVHI